MRFSVQDIYDSRSFGNGNIKTDLVFNDDKEYLMDGISEHNIYESQGCWIQKYRTHLRVWVGFSHPWDAGTQHVDKYWAKDGSAQPASPQQVKAAIDIIQGEAAVWEKELKEENTPGRQHALLWYVRSAKRKILELEMWQLSKRDLSSPDEE